MLLRRVVLLIALFGSYTLVLWGNPYDVEYIDSLYVHQPKEAYMLLQETYERLKSEGFKSTSEARYEIVAGYVCLHNKKMGEAMDHALRLQQIGEEQGDLGALLVGLNIQCDVENAVGLYHQLLSSAQRLKAIANKIPEDNHNNIKLKVFNLLYAGLVDVEALSKINRIDDALASIKEARTLGQHFASLYPFSAGNWHICRHVLDHAEIEAYLSENEAPKAYSLAQTVLAELNKEEQQGGDGVTDEAGYDIHRLQLFVNIGKAAIRSNMKKEALIAIDSVALYLSSYPNISGAIGNYCELLYLTQQYRRLFEKAIPYYKENYQEASMEMKQVCTYMLHSYLAQGNSQRAAEILKTLESLNKQISQQNQDVALAEYDALYQNGKLREKVERQRYWRVWGILLASVLLLLLLILVREIKNNLRLKTKNRKLYEDILNMQRKESEDTEKFRQEPEENLTSAEVIYRRLCMIMEEKTPYIEPTLNREDLARLTGTNHRYIDEAVMQCTGGMSTKDFINHYRMRHVVTLLSNGDENIGMVAEKSGFNSRTTFIRLFKEKFGMTPSEYRKMSQEEKTNHCC